MTDITHQMIITPKTAKTACGIAIIAHYPMSGMAMGDQAGVDQFKVTVGTKGVSCEKCKERMKSDEPA